jgi:two-component system sensor histidine kinase VicK
MLFKNDSSSSSFLDSLAEQNDLVVFAYEVASRQFTYLNPAFEVVLARKRKRLPAADALLDLVHPEDLDYLKQTYEQLLAGELKKHVEFRILLPDQTQKWLRVKPYLLEEAPGDKLIAGTAEDITDWKHYSDVETKYSNKKNAILQILSHDLAGPLGTIQALSSLVATRIKPYKDEHLDHVLGLIIQTSKSSLKIIREFVSREFLDSSEVSLVKSRIDIVQKVREVMEQLQNSQEEMAKTFKLDSSAPSIYMEVDEVKFMQVITNLLSNAIKFTHDNGVISISIADQAGTLLITVQDNGIGIPKQYHTTLFDKFTKARRPGLKQEPSIGLGMSIIKMIVEWHNGKIWFESEENKGTTFFIEIPK